MKTGLLALFLILAITTAAVQGVGTALNTGPSTDPTGTVRNDAGADATLKVVSVTYFLADYGSYTVNKVTVPGGAAIHIPMTVSPSTVCKISVKSQYTGPAGTYAWLNVWDPDAKKTMEGVAIPANTARKYTIVRGFKFDSSGSYEVYITMTGNGKWLSQEIYLDVT